MGSKSVGFKISFSVTILLIVALGVTGLISYFETRNTMADTMQTDLTNRASDVANLVNERINMYKISIQNTSNKSTVVSNNIQQQMDQLLADQKNEGFDVMGIGDSKGNVKFSNGKTENLGNQTFYQTALNSHNVAISNPFQDSTLNNFAIMVAAPIYYSGMDGGVVVGVIDGYSLCDSIVNIKVCKTGYAFMIDANGTVVAHADKTKVAKGENLLQNAKSDSTIKGIDKIISNMKQSNIGYGTYTNKGQNQDMAFAPVLDWGLYLGISVPESELYASTNSMGLQIIIFTLLFIFLGIVATLMISRVLITRPLKKTVHMIQEMSIGHLSERLKVKSKDEVGRMGEAMNNLAENIQKDVVGAMKCISDGNTDIQITVRDENDEVMPALQNTVETIKSIAGNTERIIGAANSGRLDERCDAEIYRGSWKVLAEEINGLMDSLSEPVNEVRAVISKISVNDYTTKVNGNYKGVFKDLADDVNSLGRQLLGLQEALVNISKGDTSALGEYEQVGKRSENDNMIPSMIQMMRTINDLIKEVGYLATESINGNVIKARGDSSKFEGGYKEIIDGFNSTLDALSEPLSEIITVLSAMVDNDYTQTVNTSYKGDYAKMAEAMNDVHERLLTIQNVAEKISKGDISELENFKKIGRRSENDHLVPAFTQMMESIKLLIDETTMIADSASKGNLNNRGDVSKFEGEYVGIINAINSFIEAVSKPTEEVKRIMSEIANSKFDISVEGNYNGEYEELVNAVEKTALTLKNIVSEISGTLIELSKGNFSLPEIREYNGDFKDISDALNRILDSFNELFGNIDIAAHEVAAGSKQISEGSQDLSRGATEQASSIQQLTASITEVASQTKNNALDAAQASKLAGTVKDNAVSGNGDMDDMLKSMDDISAASKNINKIIKVIDDIAFQTNILALNAAVEAARAGQYGKGFAVVAEEVRNLAARSANAAKETTDLIEGSVKKTQNGMQIAQKTSNALGNIVKGVEQVANLVEEISKASNQQATGITQIDKGLEQVSQVVQTNSATAEESASASEELSGQAIQLQSLVSQFKLRRADKAKVNVENPIRSRMEQAAAQAVKQEKKWEDLISLDNPTKDRQAFQKQTESIAPDADSIEFEPLNSVDLNEQIPEIPKIKEEVQKEIPEQKQEKVPQETEKQIKETEEETPPKSLEQTPEEIQKGIQEQLPIVQEPTEKQKEKKEEPVAEEDKKPVTETKIILDKTEEKQEVLGKKDKKHNKKGSGKEKPTIHLTDREFGKY